MIQLDISNIWVDVSLRDLLGLEAGMRNAYEALSPGTGLEGWTDQSPDKLKEVIRRANSIRLCSDTLVVLGDNEATRGAQAVIELLQGPHRNLNREQGDPQVIFVGHSLSLHQWNQLTQQLKGRDFFVFLAEEPDAAGDMTLQSLQWILCRKYGTAKAPGRIFSFPELRQVKTEEEEEGNNPVLSLFSPTGLLPMAVAGVDITALLQGAQQAEAARNSGDPENEYCQLGFENPLWMYAAARKLMTDSGRTLELLASCEPGMHSLGRYLQKLHSATLGAQLPEDEALLIQASPRIFQTMLRFAAADHQIPLPQNPAVSAAELLQQAQERALCHALDSCCENNGAMISMDCEKLCEETLGELLWFFRFTRALERRL